MATPIVFPGEEDSREEMKLRAEEKDWLKGEIGRQVGTAIEGAIDSFRPHGLRKLAYWLRQWGAVAVPFTVMVGILGIAAAAFYQANARIKEEARFEQKTEDRLERIEAALRQIQASSAPAKVFGELAQLKPAELAKNLPALRIVAEQPPKVIEPTPVAVANLKNAFLSVQETAPEYWPTLAQFLQFLSILSANDVPPPGGPVSNWSNVSARPSGMMISTPSHATVRLAGHIEGLTFRNDRIIFSAEGVNLQDVRFVDCVFQFEGNPDASPPKLKQAARELLASDNIKDATVGGM